MNTLPLKGKTLPDRFMFYSIVVTSIAATAIGFLLARGAASASHCVAYDYCAEWTLLCVLNNAIVSTSVGLSLGMTRLQCAVTRHLVETSDKGVCHIMTSPVGTELDSCMVDNVGAALAVLFTLTWVLYVSIYALRAAYCFLVWLKG